MHARVASSIQKRHGRDFAMRHRLRLYSGDSTQTAARTVSISFGEFRRIVLDAQHLQRTWLRDFESETVEVPEDLYEVLTAYLQLMPGA
jgi:hypothetical protein